MSEPRSEPIKGLVILMSCIAGVWILYWLAMFIFLQGDNAWEHRGLFGDMFGSVNALFSGLAFAGVIYAIFLQRRELELQREELRMTREELKRTADAQIKSEETFRKQADALLLTAELNSRGSLLEAYSNILELHTLEYFDLENRKQVSGLMQNHIGKLEKSLQELSPPEEMS